MITYTACFGEYDNLHFSANIRYDEGYNPYSGCMGNFSDRLKARLYKVLNPEGFDLWLDASVEVLDLEGFKSLLQADFCIFKHPFHDTIEDELRLCQKSGYINNLEVQKIRELYKDVGKDVTKVPVFATGVMYRNSEINFSNLNQYWWALISQYSYRDQLTLPLVLEKMKDIEVGIIDLDIYDNPFLKVHKHKK